LTKVIRIPISTIAGAAPLRYALHLWSFIFAWRQTLNFSQTVVFDYQNSTEDAGTLGHGLLHLNILNNPYRNESLFLLY